MILLLGAYHWIGCNDLHFISEGLCDAPPQEFAESTRKRKKNKRIILFPWHTTLALQARKYVVSLVSAPAILGTGLLQDPTSASPVCCHKALTPQRSLPWAACSCIDRSSIQSDGSAVNVRCQGACKHNPFLMHDSSSLCSRQGFWFG